MHEFKLRVAVQIEQRKNTAGYPELKSAYSAITSYKWKIITDRGQRTVEVRVVDIAGLVMRGEVGLARVGAQLRK